MTTYTFSGPDTYALLDAAMCLWEAALAEPRLMDRLREDAGALNARENIQILAPICDMAWQYARDRLNFDDCFDWIFAPAFLEQATLHMNALQQPRDNEKLAVKWARGVMAQQVNNHE